MDYAALAEQMLEKMHVLRKASPQKHINESLQGEAFILRYISSHGVDVLPGEISGEMNVSSARIAAALNSLESKVLITRQIDPNNRRQILVNITPEGKAIAEKQQATVIEYASKMLALLGERDAREYVRITCKLANIMSTNHIEL